MRDLQEASAGVASDGDREELPVHQADARLRRSVQEDAVRARMEGTRSGTVCRRVTDPRVPTVTTPFRQCVFQSL